MRTTRLLLAPALAVGLTIIGCGGDEPPATSTPTAPAGTVPVGCVGKWTSGASGTVTCTASGPNKDRVKIDETTFRLDRLCVNDARITSFTSAGGKTTPIAAKPEAGNCAQFGGLQQLPQTCTCTPPAGGDCTPPPGGFACVAVGSVPLAGG